MSIQEIEELEEFSVTMAATMATVTVGMLIVQAFLYLGLKYLWNLMNLLQFLIFMQMWLVSLPGKARIFLR